MEAECRALATCGGRGVGVIGHEATGSNPGAWLVAGHVRRSAHGLPRPGPGEAGVMSGSRVSRGDAEAVLQAAPTGGGAIRSHGIVNPSAPTDIELRTSIRPFSGTVFDGRHYCAEDWHVILLLDFEGGDRSFTEQDARAIMDQITFDFSLDGAPLATNRLPIKRFLAPQPFFETAYYFQQGVVLPPSALTVGSHTVGVSGTDPRGNFTDQITIHIDAPGTGVCR
jgi:hypothetical protein